MIREQLLVLEARRRGMTLSAAQAEEELKKDPFFQDVGGFDEAKYLAIKVSQPERFQQALSEIQRTLPARRLKEQLERQSAPDRDRLRAELERKLGRVVIDFLALRRSEFAADLPEPSEREVLEYHRAHAADFQLPEQARLSLVTVGEPGPGAAELVSPSAIQAWESRMRGRADSLLGVLRRGARLEELAGPFGGVRSVQVTRDAFPDDWRGGESHRRAVFSAARGALLPEPVPADRGFMVVRVDERLPARPARLREVAAAVRARARAELRAERERRELGALYAALRDSLRGPARRIRYAVADTGAFRVPEPTAAELDRFYRGHLADYSFFDSRTGSVGARPFAEVRHEIRARLLQERRLSGTREAAQTVLAAWKAGKRDARAERTMTLVKEVGPVPLGGTVDEGPAGAALTDALAQGAAARFGALPFERGWIAYQVVAEVQDHVPSFEQARSLLLERRQPSQEREQEAAARRLYEEDPRRFAPRHALRFSRLMVEPPSVLDVPLRREEVEQYYHAHLERYSAPELARVRHVLIAPRDASPEADEEARREAEDVLRRARAGESFIELARRHSDDEATRPNGGDVGVFGRGMMLDQFEALAFSMEPGEIGGPVRTEVGHHVLQCLERVPAEVTPLKYCYSTVASSLAQEKAMRMARLRADSLRRVLRSPAQAAALARRQGILVYQNEHVIGTPIHVKDLKSYFAKLETLKAGQFHPDVQEYRGMGYAVTWVDTILPPRAPSWEEAREQALELYRREGDRRRMLAKRAELDSLLRAGWSLDSLATLYGGLERFGPSGPGGTLERLGGQELLDSLAFGGDGRPAVLREGEVTDWIEFPAGLAKLRLAQRIPADPIQVASRLETESWAVLEMNLRAAFDRMKQRFPVQILDPELRLVELPKLTDS
jgi:parvulin-like peptidyl-prolyl isomerase